MTSFSKSTCAAIAHLFTASQVMWRFGRKVAVYLEKCRLISVWSLPPTECILRVRTSMMTFSQKSSWIWDLPASFYFKKKSISKRRLELCDTRSVFIDCRKMTHNPIENHPSQSLFKNMSKFKHTHWTFLQKDGSGDHRGILCNALQLLKYTEATWAFIARNEVKNARHHR